MTTPHTPDLWPVGPDGDMVDLNAPRRSPPAVLAKADLIAAEQHAWRAAEALGRAIRQYAADGSGEYALARVRARAALAKIQSAMPFIDGDDEKPSGPVHGRAQIRAGIRARRQESGK